MLVAGKMRMSVESDIAPTAVSINSPYSKGINESNSWWVANGPVNVDETWSVTETPSPPNNYTYLWSLVSGSGLSVVGGTTSSTLTLRLPNADPADSSTESASETWNCKITNNAGNVTSVNRSLTVTAENAGS